MRNIELFNNIIAGVLENPTDECVEWPKARDWDGYGIVWNGRHRRCHRLALEAKLQRPITDGMFACHTCDNPPCINPNHLFEATCRDNLRDMWRKGRDNNPLGPSHGNAKVTTEDVADIRRFRGLGITYDVLAELFDLSATHVRDICCYRYRRVA